MANFQIFIKACRLGDFDLLKSELEKDPDCINDTDDILGWTGLYCSVICGHHDITKFLIENKANVNIKNRMGETPLHQAVENSDLQMVNLLVKHEANPNIQQNDGETPLHLAVLKSHCKIVSILLKHNANPSILNFVYSKSPLNYAVESSNTKVLKKFIKYSPDAKEKLENTSADLMSKLSEKPLLRLSPDLSETILTSQLFPYTRCNSDISSSTDYKAINWKIQQIESINKMIRETVKISVDTNTNKRKHQSSSAVELDAERTASETRIVGSDTKLELYQWLKSLKLSQEYNLLVYAGFDDLNQLIKQMKSCIPLTENTLIKIGMNKPGHRRRLLAGLDGLANKEENSKIFSRFHCCTAAPFVGWMNTLTLENWLEELCLSDTVELFKEAGFDDVDDLLSLVNTRWAVDEQLLIDIGIDKPGYRQRILAKVDEKSFERKSDGLVIEKTVNNSACELCNII